MSNNIVKLNMFNDVPMLDIYLWSKKQEIYKNMLVVLDTGASMTTLSKDVLFMLGYDVSNATQSRVTTASSVEYVSDVILDKMRIGTIELPDVKVYGHTFPQESFATGVIGMNVLRQFDLELLFSQNKLILKSSYARPNFM